MIGNIILKLFIYASKVEKMKIETTLEVFFLLH